MQAWFFAIALALLGLACGDDTSAPDGGASDAGDAHEDDSGIDAGGGAPPNAGGSALIGPTGGVVKTSDGKITLTIPAGALKSDAQISIEPLPKGASKALLKDGIELVSYRLAPDGLVFEEPITLSVKLPELISPSGDQAVVPLVFASSFSKNTLAFLTTHDLAIALESGDAVLETELEHFSDLSVQNWAPNNKLKTPYFYFELAPMPPAELELSKDYGLGSKFSIRHFLSDDLPLTYTDQSVGLVYSGGTEPLAIGSIPGAGSRPSSFVMPAGSYGCTTLGEATYEARLVTDTFLATPVPVTDCDSANDKAKCAAAPAGPTKYFVKLRRDVTCVPDEAVAPDASGAPFSGYVIHARNHDISSMGELTDSHTLSGAFYDGGADQAAFDSFVRVQRRHLGIMPRRGANGTCRSADEKLYDANVINLDIELSHVGEGADDLLGLDFLAPPSDPLFTASFETFSGLYDSSISYNEAFTEQGLAVHIPVSAATPTIILPGWDENVTRDPVFTPGNALAALSGSDIAITWQADEVGGELIHIVGVGGDAAAETRAFECFAEIEDQLLTIPSKMIADLFATGTDPLWMSITVYSGSHTTATYKGRTLDGFNVRRYSRYEETPDPNNPDG